MTQTVIDKLPIRLGGTDAVAVSGARQNLGMTYEEPHSNIIYNACGQIQQRGNVASIGNGSYGLDGWKAQYSGSMVCNHNRATATWPTLDFNNIVSSTTLPYSGTYSHQIEVTTADASMAASDYFEMKQFIEANKFLRVYQIPFLVQVAFYAPGAGIQTLCVSNDNDRYYLEEFVVSSGWNILRMYVPAITDGTWNTQGVSAGMSLRIPICAGSDYFGTAGGTVWRSGNLFAAPNQTNWCNTTQSVYFTDVRVTPGWTPNTQPVKTLQEDFKDCYRYYQRVRGLAAVANQVWSGGAYSANCVVLPGPMRTAPTLSSVISAGTGGTFGLLYNDNNNSMCIYQEAANSAGAVVDHTLTAEF